MEDAQNPPDASTPDATAAMAQSRGLDDAPSAAGASIEREPLAIAFTLGERVADGASALRYERSGDDPVFRPLKIYTTDPISRRQEGETALINIPYEALLPGPVGLRFQVESTVGGPLGVYDAVNLEDPRLLIVNGRDPAPTDPVFHHQMAYAVAMSVYAAFRTALGRELSWGFGKPRLRLVPHAIEGANAQYVRESHALEFGWYRVKLDHAGALPPNGLVFACLSHDVIAHELTHALLDGLRIRFDKSTNPDVPAFHEAFADLVALFQRFSYEEVVRNAIRRTSGDLSQESQLLLLAVEFGHGRGDKALRQVDLKAENHYDPALPMHALGAVLVSAVIEAFLKVYTRKAEPFIRMATGGRRRIGDDESLSAELVDALTHVARRLASQFLTMCIRAIDYCPPLDIDFGEYLRALVTADRDLVPDDVYDYREALIEAFARRRIYPNGVISLTEDALLWRRPTLSLRQEKLAFGRLRFAGDPGVPASEDQLKRQARLLGKLVTQREHLDEFGLAANGDPKLDGDRVEPPVIESIRSSRRVGPDGQLAFDLVAEVSQCRVAAGGGGNPDFKFYGGATVILGPGGEVRFVISKSIKNKVRLQRQREFAGPEEIDASALRQCRYEPSEGMS